MRWLAAGAVAAVTTVLALLAVAGEYPGEGPVLLRLSRSHGVHLGDLVVAAAWLLCLVLVALLARRPGPPGGAGRQDAPG